MMTVDVKVAFNNPSILEADHNMNETDQSSILTCLVLPIDVQWDF